MQVPRCVAWMAEPGAEALVFSLRSFALQSSSLRLALHRHGFVPAVLEAARRGQPAAIDVLQDLLKRAASHSESQQARG